MKTLLCKKSCCSVTYCPLVSAWGTTIHKFQGFEAGFDEKDQFRHLIIDPGDIKSEQQQPGLLYVATSRVKTIGDMTQDVPHPKNSALYWTGSGMSINRVMNGTTKKQQNTQGQERVNCLKVEKRRKWVRYLTDRKEITTRETYNNEKLKRIKTEHMDIMNGKIHHDVEASITNMIINPNEEWMARKKTHYLS
jgi:hypothetical protein